MYCCNGIFKVSKLFNVCDETHTFEYEDCEGVDSFVFYSGSYQHSLPASCTDGVITITGTLPAGAVVGHFIDDENEFLFDNICFILQVKRTVTECNDTEPEPEKTFISC